MTVVIRGQMYRWHVDIAHQNLSLKINRRGIRKLNISKPYEDVDYVFLGKIIHEEDLLQGIRV